MPEKDSEKVQSTRRRTTILRRNDQVCVAALLAAALLATVGHWFYVGGHRGRLIDIEKAKRLPVDFQLDVNRADWPQWTLLPGIGETLARRIVASRRDEGPFLDHSDLRRVSGIGPKTLARMRPYLQPMPPAENVAGP